MTERKTVSSGGSLGQLMFIHADAVERARLEQRTVAITPDSYLP